MKLSEEILLNIMDETGYILEKKRIIKEKYIYLVLILGGKSIFAIFFFLPYFLAILLLFKLFFDDIFVFYVIFFNLALLAHN